MAIKQGSIVKYKNSINTNNGNTKGIVFEDSMGCGIGFF